MSRKQRLRSLGNLLQLRDTTQCSRAREIYRQQYQRAARRLHNEKQLQAG
ncbi:hypothetical protein WJ0W_006390 [Paenibacillus melissococcoides]|uniref:Uncharacterized protein n=1 Tax=Paenibacillus melissococcoides TaxID=2912268 RepID=A0ABM9GBZ5_9BACL|nr:MULTISPECIES: hypothetical protein [Paenibacillus]GIO76690.1 hypothetical protein J6TS7_03000 [Paenibacillus dendritiformis]CAH8249204.1 hypothetical protein WJ0W_006390 [Paenibacillus melissococcoides]